MPKATAGGASILLEAVDCLCKASTWAETRALIEAHPELLSSAAQRALRSLEHDSLTPIIPLRRLHAFHRDLLLLCRRKGVYEAFRPLGVPCRPDDQVKQGSAPPAAIARDLRRLARLREREWSSPQAHASINALIERVLRRVPPNQAPGFRADLYVDLGRNYLLQSRYDDEPPIGEAAACYWAAITIYGREGLRQEQAEAQVALAQALVEFPGPDPVAGLKEAISLLGDVLMVCSLEEAPRDWAGAHRCLAQAHRALAAAEGRPHHLHESLSHCYQALRVFGGDNHPLEYARVLTTMGDAYLSLHSAERIADVRRAIASYRQALRFLEPAHDPHDSVRVQNNLGLAYKQLAQEGYPPAWDLAVACFEAALTTPGIASATLTRARVLNNLGIARAALADEGRQGAGAEAIRYFRMADRLIAQREPSLDKAQIRGNLGRVLMRHATEGQSRREAERYLRAALVVQTVAVDPRGHRRASSHLGDLYARAKRWSDALEAYNSAIAAHERLYDRAGAEEARTAELGQNASLFVRKAYCLARLGRVADGRQTLEAGRARALRSALSRTVADTADAAQDGRPFDGEPRRRSGEFGMPALGADRCALVYLATTELGSAALIAPTDSEAADADNIVWCHALRENEMRELLISRDGKHGLLGAAQRGTTLAVCQSLDEVLPVLGERLMAPVVERLHDLHYARALLVPCGLLGLLPLHLAHVDGRYAQECLSLGYTPSAGVLRALHARGPVSAEPRFLAMANPTHTSEVRREGDEPAFAMYPLPLAEAEAMAIGRLMAPHPSRILSGDAATREQVRSALGQASHIHFACHGVLDCARPLQSGLALAGSDWLTVSDLLAMDGGVRAELVTLSACNTLLADFRSAPDELVGLPAAFLRAGAKQVVGSFWPVPEAATMMLMTRFYRHYLVDGLTPTLALQRAQSWLRQATAKDLREGASASRQTRGHAVRVASPRGQEGKAPYAHPYHWGAFAVFGGA